MNDSLSSFVLAMKMLRATLPSPFPTNECGLCSLYIQKEMLLQFIILLSLSLLSFDSLSCALFFFLIASHHLWNKMGYKEIIHNLELKPIKQNWKCVKILLHDTLKKIRERKKNICKKICSFKSRISIRINICLNNLL